MVTSLFGMYLRSCILYNSNVKPFIILLNSSICKFHLPFLNFQSFSKISIRKFTDIKIQNSEILNNPYLQNYIMKIKSEFENNNLKKLDNLKIEIDPKKLNIIVNLINNFHSYVNDIKSLNELILNIDNEDKDFTISLNKEIKLYEEKLIDVEKELITALMPTTENESCDDIVFEIDCGVGGQEAMLFAQDLYHMYNNFFIFNNWTHDITDFSPSEIGGLKRCVILVSGSNAYKFLNLEAGVHRVQRIPKTENSGRIHTSTVSVAVYPQLSEIDVEIDKKDIKIQTKNASAPGGQHVNKTQSAIRIHHLPTGIIVECENERSQHINKKIAMQKLRLKLFTIESEKQTKEIKGVKKSQIGTKSRNEKIRTYNFPQDRITDHRFNKSVKNLPKILEGGSYFANFICELLEICNKRKKEEFLKKVQFLSE